MIGWFLITCHPDGVVAKQQVGARQPARVDARVLVGHVDDAQDPLSHPRAVAGRQQGAIFEPADGLRVVFQVAGHFQGVPHGQDIVLQEGRLAGHRVWKTQAGFSVSQAQASGIPGILESRQEAL